MSGENLKTERIGEKLREQAAAFGLEMDQRAGERFVRYAGMLLEWNEKVNLTAITEPEGICTRHFMDSLLVLKALTLKTGARLADVGTGAGFPGVPLKILRPDLELTLIDSLDKRLNFLRALGPELGLEWECVHLRGEEAGKNPLYRERFDLVTARAVAAMNLLGEYCLPLVKVGGTFAALKGPETEEELEAAKNALETLGGRVSSVARFTLADGSGRSIVCVEKISQTSTKYPRAGGKIAKSPL